MRLSPVTYSIVNAPIPSRARRHKESKYPFEELQIGQSFFVPGNETKISLMRRHCARWGKRNKASYDVAMVGGQFQVWRLA